jgi:PAS domain-containing protein
MVMCEYRDRLTGKRPTSSYSSRINPGDLEMVMCEYRDRLTGKRPTSSYSSRIITKDGQEKHIFMIEWDGKPAALALLTDITEQVQVRMDLKQSEGRFRNLMEQSPMDIVIMTPEGQITDVNTAWMRNWGVQADETDKIFKAYNMRTDSQFEDLGYAPLVEKAFAGESVVLPPIHYIPNRTLDEMGLEGIEMRERWIQCHFYAIKDMNGSVESVVGINMEITELKQAEIQLRSTFEEIAKLKDQLQAESTYLQEEIKLEHNFENIIGQSEALKYVLNRVEQVAPMDSPVSFWPEPSTVSAFIANGHW